MNASFLNIKINQDKKKNNYWAKAKTKVQQRSLFFNMIGGMVNNNSNKVKEAKGGDSNLVLSLKR